MEFKSLTLIKCAASPAASLPVDLLEYLEDLDEEVDDVEVQLDGGHDVLLGAQPGHDHLHEKNIYIGHDDPFQCTRKPEASAGSLVLLLFQCYSHVDALTRVLSADVNTVMLLLSLESFLLLSLESFLLLSLQSFLLMSIQSCCCCH